MIPTGGLLAAATEVVDQPSRTWRLDFDRGRVAGMIDELDAVKQAVYKVLQTERFAHPIYDGNYGSELAGLIGLGAGFAKSELRRRIKEALMQDDRVSDVVDFEIAASGENLTARFVVVSKYGNFGGEAHV